MSSPSSCTIESGLDAVAPSKRLRRIFDQWNEGT
jgi:hypothetical protein